ncbi:efflux RND transporter periplasmic adaptor subunit [Roseovarius sp. CAU 1744]|uniref:efflux RND transporter periplasmic adaptor subunit n=1 Tax=Roseovarius sp. CAU 1744 TaxID=3140368 RepID=UPI00325C2EB4
MSTQVSFLKQLAVAVLLLALAGGAWHQRAQIAAILGLGPAPVKASRNSDQGVPVIVARVSTARDDVVLEAVGTGRAVRSVMLRTETAGKIAEMSLVADQRYARDDVLLRLDRSAQQLAVELAETRLAEAIRIRDRVSRLQGSGAAAVARLDEVVTAAEIARLELESARDALEDRVLRAPFDGVAGLSEVEAGAWIDSDTDIASFDDRSVLLVEFDLPEALISRIRPTTVVTATTPAAPGREFEGTVTAVDSRIAAQSRTVRVRVTLPNPEDVLKPGASFTVRLELPGDVYPVVPELAVLFSRGTLHVWRVTEEGMAERVEVRMIRRSDGAILIDGPLAEGDLVVVEGTQRMAPGKAVRILNDTGAGPA